jgi:hypothetical protein
MAIQKTLSEHINEALKQSQFDKFVCDIIETIPVNVILTSAAYKWISLYKTDYRKFVEQEFSKTHINKLKFQQFLTVKYFYEWVLQKDFIPSLPALPHEINNILNIGAGVGLFDIYLKGLYPNVNLNFIELDEYDEISHFDLRLEKLEGKINAITLLKENLDENNVHKFNIFKPEEAVYIEDSSIDLVLSFRSWSFLYPVETYSKIVQKILTKNGKIICDVLKSNYDKFSEYFNIISDIGEADSLIRVLAENK